MDLLTFTLTVAALLLLILLIGWLAQRRRAELLATVREEVLPSVASRHLGNSRDVVVYLPLNGTDLGRDLPLLLVNDGQDREALKLRETLATLFARKEIPPIVVAAIPTNDDRLQEYGTAIAPTRHGFGHKAAAYAAFVVEELLPLLAEKYPVQTTGVAIVGASLGGLSAFDLAWNHPQVFDTVGVMSGSFWWRASAEETAITPDKLIAHEMVRRGHFLPGWRGWFEAATRDETSDRDGNGVIDAIQDTLELLDELDALGFELGRDVAYVQVEGGRHEYETWSRVLPDFLRWAFG